MVPSLASLKNRRRTKQKKILCQWAIILVYLLFLSSNFLSAFGPVLHRSVYNLLTNLLPRHSTPVSCRICINFTCWNAFCQSLNQGNIAASTSSVRSDILSIPTAFLFLFPLLNTNWIYPSMISMSFSFNLPSILAAIFAACVIKLAVRWSLYFLAFGFFLKTVITKSV